MEAGRGLNRWAAEHNKLGLEYIYIYIYITGTERSGAGTGQR